MSPKNKLSVTQIIEDLLYILPYVIQQRKLHPSRPTKTILSKMRDAYENGLPHEKEQLRTDIEMAYLNKEIERMYERLAKAGKDTAIVSDKLNELKKRHKKGSFL